MSSTEPKSRNPVSWQHLEVCNLKKIVAGNAPLSLSKLITLNFPATRRYGASDGSI